MRIILAVAMTAALAVSAIASSYDDFNVGLQLRNSQDWPRALVYFDKALAAGDLTPNQKFTALLNRAEAQLALKHPDLALPDYTAALALQPASAFTLWSRAEVYESQKKYDLAIADLDAVIAAHPQLPSPLSARARVNLERGLADKSRDDMRAVLALMPQDAQGREIGIIYWQLGQMPEAYRNLDYAVDKRQDLYSWFWLSLVNLRTGKAVPKRDLPDYDKSRWPAPLVGFFLGALPQQGVFDAAARADKEEAVAGQTCEADFYVGEWLLLHHDDTGAPLLRKAAGECPADFIEWSPAQMDAAALP